MQYPSNMRIIRVMCSGSVSPHHMIKALQQGADGVFVGGCHQGECNYLYGNYTTEKRVTVLTQMLDFCGVERERLRAKWVSSAEAPEFVDEISDFVEILKELGPSPLKHTRKQAVA